MTLAESQGKKVAFLREAIRTLGVPVEVWPQRVEMLPPSRSFDVITLRAVDEPGAALELARSPDTGRWSGSAANQSQRRGRRAQDSGIRTESGTGCCKGVSVPRGTCFHCDRVFHVEHTTKSSKLSCRTIQEPSTLKRIRMSPRPNQPQIAPSRARIIAVVNQKGGVGKTTTAVNLAACLALEGKQVLLLDCDPQANTSGGLGIRRERDEDPQRASTYDLLVGESDLHQATMKSDIAGLWLVPGSKNLIGANVELVSQPRREFRLRDALQPARSRYDYILMDCPPALDLLTLNALVAADGLLVPVQAEYYALEGISELISTLDRVAQAFNPGLGLEGVVLTMYDDRTNLSQQVTQNLKQYFGVEAAQNDYPAQCSPGGSSFSWLCPFHSTTQSRAERRHTQSLPVSFSGCMVRDQRSTTQKNVKEHS